MAVPANCHYPKLFSPLEVGRLRLRNRLVMGPMHTGLEGVEGGLERMAEFYGERARAGVALIITGGYSPNHAGAASAGLGIFDSEATATGHRCITQTVHEAGGQILLQILHAGGYARHGAAVAASAVRTPLCPIVPKALDEEGIEEVIAAHVQCAQLAEMAGYDGVDLLGAGGYLLNGFFSPHTNRRRDRWGGTLENRSRLALDIVRRIRDVTGSNFVIAFRLSLLDLVQDGSTFDDALRLGQLLSGAGVDLLGSTFGWHESRVPTISAAVPPAAFSDLTAQLSAAVPVPVMASNRISTPEQAELLLANEVADLVALARPLLADAQFAEKAAQGKAHEINTCIACNQSCLDRTFSQRVVSCVVNPRACHETKWTLSAAGKRKRIAVVGAGISGLACAAVAAGRGMDVTLFESRDRPGGQFLLASRVPYKSDYAKTIQHYLGRLSIAGGTILLQQQPTPAELTVYDHVVLATGVVHREPVLEGVDHPSVMHYDDLLSGRRRAGSSVVIVGAGGIAFDVAEYLLTSGVHDSETFFLEWGIAAKPGVPGGLVAAKPLSSPSRQVYMLQRSTGRPGKSLGLTTGWTKRIQLERSGLRILVGTYPTLINDLGVTVQTGGGESRTIEANTVVLCAGQEPSETLSVELERLHVPVTVIGGARNSVGLDAERAVFEGWRLAYNL